MWGKSSGGKSGQRKWGGERYFESSVTLGSYQYYADPSLSLPLFSLWPAVTVGFSFSIS